MKKDNFVDKWDDRAEYVTKKLGFRHKILSFMFNCDKCHSSLTYEIKQVDAGEKIQHWEKVDTNN
ncbi:MAG: hypothetical protein V3U02_04370 [Calditrichia bacterium]